MALPPDVKPNTGSQVAFDTAVQFYKLDHNLTKQQRQKLADAYNSISYFTLGSGWTGFIAFMSVPFALNRVQVKYNTAANGGANSNTTSGANSNASASANGSSTTNDLGSKGPNGSIKSIKLIKPKGRANMGLALMLGMVGLMIFTPIGSSYAYSYQLTKMKQTDEKCSKVMELLKPGETMRWWLYYTMTVEKPELIMKDPRTKEAYERRSEKEGKSKIYSNGNDVIGLYSGPAHELKEIKKRKERGVIDDDNVTDDDVERYQSQSLSQDHDQSHDDDDPFESKPNVQEYKSAWDRVRSQTYSDNSNNSNQSNNGSVWNRVRNSNVEEVKSNSNGYYQEENNNNDYDNSDVSFEELLERERRLGQESER